MTAKNSTHSPVTSYLANNWSNLTLSLPELKQSCYSKLIELYTFKERHYHNLSHIEALLKLSDRHQDLLESKEIIDYTIWYHDAIYDASQNDNEEKSAQLAKEDLSKLGLDANLINSCYDLIVATKTHQLDAQLSSFDAQFLLDIDLSILASDGETYIEYTQQIRNEYKMYPDFLYNKGRKKVLKHFLEMDEIYKTELFQNLWEEKARTNLKLEFTKL